MVSHALRQGGVCTKKFDQGARQRGQGFVRSVAKYNADQPAAKMTGVCVALSAVWIAHHAWDRDFWGWLYGEPMQRHEKPEPNKYYERLLASSGRFIVDVQKAYMHEMTVAPPDLSFAQMGKRTGARMARRMIDGFMSQLGIGRHYRGDVSKSNLSRTASNLASQLAPDRFGGGGCYKELNITGPGGGHACAAWVGEDVTYFDPNYGEFWFPTTTAFRYWFFNYWAASMYPNKAGKFYEIVTYARLRVG